MQNNYDELRCVSLQNTFSGLIFFKISFKDVVFSSPFICKAREETSWLQAWVWESAWMGSKSWFPYCPHELLPGSEAHFRKGRRIICSCIHRRLPRQSSGKESACQCRRHKRHGFEPWVRKIPWKKAWQPTPWKIPWTEGAWQATVHGVAKSQTRLSTHFYS